jgi:hypothetical protein
MLHASSSFYPYYLLFKVKHNGQEFIVIKFPWKKFLDNKPFLLLTTKESAMDVPSNFKARRRISLFSNSLFMDMPTEPKVCNMLSFS